MPFTARCVNCGFVVMANKRKTLEQLKEDHDGKSHKSLESEWITSILTHIDYAMLIQASKVSAFWNAINKRLK